MKIGKEVHTKIIHKIVGSLGSGITDRSSTEFVAPENMYIIGVGFGKAANSGGGQGIMSIARGGTYKEMGSYTGGEEFVSDDGLMFHWSSNSLTVEELPLECSRTHMLPDGDYFFLEKGERVYMHNSSKNASAAGTFSFGATAVLYYTKTKP